MERKRKSRESEIRTDAEISASSRATRDSDYEHKLRAAQEELTRIQQQRLVLESRKQELERLTEKKRQAIAKKIPLLEKLTTTLTVIDRTLYEGRQQMEVLEQCRVCFAAHIRKLESIDEAHWTRESLDRETENALRSIEHAEDEYGQAASFFAESDLGNIFQETSYRRSKNLIFAPSLSEADRKENDRLGLWRRLTRKIWGSESVQGSGDLYSDRSLISRTGILPESFDRLLHDLAISEEELKEILGIHKISSSHLSEKLRSESSERFIRMQLIAQKAFDIFEDKQSARHWMMGPKLALGGKTPLNCCTSEKEALSAEYLLGRIEHGVFS